MTKSASRERSAEPSAVPPVAVEHLVTQAMTRASTAKLERVKIDLRQRLATTRQQHQGAVKRHDHAAMHQLLYEGRRLVRDIHAVDALLARAASRTARQAAVRAAAVLRAVK
jgi:hypothetical protein